MSDRPTPKEQKENLAGLILEMRDERVALKARIAELGAENQRLKKDHENLSVILTGIAKELRGRE